MTLTRSAFVLVTAAATVAVVMSAGGCSGTSDEPAQPGPSPAAASASTADDSVRRETARVLAAYNGFQERYITAAAAANFEDKLLRSYVADPLLAEVSFALRQQSEQGIVYRGRPAWKAGVTKIDLAGHTATISDCFDNNTWRAVYKSTGKAVPAPSQAQRYLVTSTAKLYDDGRWLIADSKADRSRAC